MDNLSKIVSTVFTASILGKTNRIQIMNDNQEKFIFICKLIAMV